MEIEALPPVEQELALPLLLLLCCIPFIIIGFKLLGSEKRKQKTLAFISTGLGVALLACGLIPVTASLSGTNMTEEYRSYLYEEYDLRLEENSSLARAMSRVNQDTVMPLQHVAVAYRCDDEERVNSFDLFVTRHEDTIYIHEQDGSPFEPCTVRFVPQLRKM